MGGTRPLWCNVVEDVVHVSGCVHTMYVLTKLRSSLQPLAPYYMCPPQKMTTSSSSLVSTELLTYGFVMGVLCSAPRICLRCSPLPLVDPELDSLLSLPCRCHFHPLFLTWGAVYCLIHPCPPLLALHRRLHSRLVLRSPFLLTPLPLHFHVP